MIVVIAHTTIGDPIDKFTDWEWFQSLASEWISPRIQINLGEEAIEVATIASVYRIMTRKVTLSDLNNYLPSLESLLNISRG
jgi:hypothetical protein